jgi:hypothetical protein
MEEALRFFKDYEFWIYLLLALGGLVYIRKFILAWDELRGAAFGLERESAQSRLNNAASMLVLLLAMGLTVFVFVSFVIPSVPGANPLLTPTLDLLATSTTTLQATVPITDTTQVLDVTSTPPTIEPAGNEGCVPGELILTEPEDGSEISGIVTLKGTADIQNFGFYKYEVARPGDTIWLTIQAGRTAIQDGELGQWDTRTLSPGDYILRLVVTDNQGETLPPCVIRVYVNNPVTP